MCLLPETSVLASSFFLFVCFFGGSWRTARIANIPTPCCLHEVRATVRYVQIHDRFISDAKWLTSCRSKCIAMFQASLLCCCVPTRKEIANKKELMQSRIQNVFGGHKAVATADFTAREVRYKEQVSNRRQTH